MYHSQDLWWMPSNTFSKTFLCSNFKGSVLRVSTWEVKVFICSSGCGGKIKRKTLKTEHHQKLSWLNHIYVKLCLSFPNRTALSRSGKFGFLDVVFSCLETSPIACITNEILSPMLESVSVVFLDTMRVCAAYFESVKWIIIVSGDDVSPFLTSDIKSKTCVKTCFL